MENSRSFQKHISFVSLHFVFWSVQVWTLPKCWCTFVCALFIIVIGEFGEPARVCVCVCVFEAATTCEPERVNWRCDLESRCIAAPLLFANSDLRPGLSDVSVRSWCALNSLGRSSLCTCYHLSSTRHYYYLSVGCFGYWTLTGGFLLALHLLLLVNCFLGVDFGICLVADFLVLQCEKLGLLN